MTRFDVTASCGDAYEGVASVSMCKEPGEPCFGDQTTKLSLFFFCNSMPLPLPYLLYFSGRSF